MLEDLCDVTTSINFAKSEDSYSSDLQSSPKSHKKNSNSYKCYRCYGTGNQNCNQCSGTQHISQNHPMALLLNNILIRKLNLKRSHQDKEEQHETVQIIKEEEEDNDEKKIICSFCSRQCEFSLLSCPHCLWFHVCSSCQERSSEHHHQLRKTIPINHGTQLSRKKICASCSQSIQNYYSICVTCSSSGQLCCICDDCLDNKNNIHQTGHIMEAVIDYETYKDNQMETVSQQFSDEMEKSISLSSEKLPQIDVLSNDLQLVKKISSISHYLDNGDQSPLFNCNTSINPSQKHEPMSRVKFQLEELFGSCQFSTSFNVLSSTIMRQSMLKGEEFQHYNLRKISKSNCKENRHQQSKGYVFSDYKCDICQVHPIRNVRYHCTECQDFDACQKCYDKVYQNHQHITFDRIDAKLMREKAVQKLINERSPTLKTSLNLNVRKTTRSKTVRMNTLFN